MPLDNWRFSIDLDVYGGLDNLCEDMKPFFDAYRSTSLVLSAYDQVCDESSVMEEAPRTDISDFCSDIRTRGAAAVLDLTPAKILNMRRGFFNSLRERVKSGKNVGLLPAGAPDLLTAKFFRQPVDSQEFFAQGFVLSEALNLPLPQAITAMAIITARPLGKLFLDVQAQIEVMILKRLLKDISAASDRSLILYSDFLVTIFMRPCVLSEVEQEARALASSLASAVEKWRLSGASFEDNASLQDFYKQVLDFQEILDCILYSTITPPDSILVKSRRGGLQNV